MVPVVADGNPFPGLRPFEQRDSRIFFGRDDHVDDLLERLDASRFIAIVGSSASGKSSLVRAGLLPALYGGSLARAGSRWRIAVMRPGGNALGSLASALEHCGVLGTGGDAPTRLGIARAVLESGELGLSEIVAQAEAADAKNLLLVVDQFEELFRFTRDRDDAAAFVKLLLAASARAEPPIYVLITMRADFIGECSAFRNLPETIGDGLFLVPRLGRDQLREAIEGPVSIAGATIEPALVTQLLNDLGNSPDQLPVLQHALMRTWDRWAERHDDSPIDRAAFEATGGLAHALSRHGEELLGELSPERRIVAERMFRALTDRSDRKRGVRRPTSFANLVAVTGASVEDLRAVIETFRAVDCAFVGPAPPAELRDDTVIDITHESLMRVWTRLTDWTAKEADSARVYRRIADAAELYARGKGALLVDPALESDLGWRAVSAPTAAWAERYAPHFEGAMRFLDESAAARGKQREDAAKARRRRLGFVAGFSLAVLLLGITVFGAFGLLRERGATLAAQSRGLARDAQSAIDRGDAVTGMLLALEALPEHLDHPDRPFVLAAQDALQRALASKRELLDYTGHDGAVIQAVFSPDGTRVASASSDGTARIWDASNGKTLGTLPGHFGIVGALAWSPDGHRLVAGLGDATVRTWDAKTLRPLVVMRGHRQAVYWAEFSPDGRRIVTAAHDATTRIFDATTGKQLRRFDLNGLSETAHFFPDGRRIFTGSIGGPGRIWDAATGKSLLDLQGDLSGNLGSSINGDGTRIATGGYGHKIQLWDARTGKKIWEVEEPDSIFHAVSFSPDGRRLVTSWHNTRLQIWNAADGSPLFELGEHDGRIWTARFSPDGKHLVSGSGDRTARVWNVAPQAVRFLRADGAALTSARPSPDGTRVITAGADHIIRVWGIADARVRIAIRDGFTGDSTTNSAAFSHDGRRFVTAGDDGRIQIWDAASGRKIRVLASTGTSIVSAEYSPDDRTVLGVADDKTLRTWDATTGTPKFVVTRPNQPEVAAYSPGGRFFLSGTIDSATVWDARTGKVVVDTPRQDGAVYAAAFSPDEKTFIAGYGDGSARIWSAVDGKLLRLLRGHDDAISSAEFSPDGKLVATTSADATARIWDPVTGTPLYVIRNGEMPLASGAFTSGGRRFVTAAPDGTTAVWTLPTFARCQAMIDQARTSLPRALSDEQRAAESIGKRGSSLAGLFMGGETCR